MISANTAAAFFVSFLLLLAKMKARRLEAKKIKEELNIMMSLNVILERKHKAMY